MSDSPLKPFASARFVFLDDYTPGCIERLRKAYGIPVEQMVAFAHPRPAMGEAIWLGLRPSTNDYAHHLAVRLRAHGFALP
jgi:hypothetical protein